MGRGNTLLLLGSYYYGFSISFGGAIVGLIWGFIHGFIFGLAIAWLYGKFYDAIYKTDASKTPL
jgi:NhaP-type Na+/H+ or K+/H+ antiporter